MAIRLRALPAAEAVAFFRRKFPLRSFDFRDVEAEEHAIAFTMAKAMQLDVLRTVQEELERQLREGPDLRAFRASLEPRLRALGWWGRRKRVDPLTGEERTVTLGTPRRLETIFRTNVRTAYAAGAWARQRRLAERAPWLLYDAVLDSRTRPKHREWDGTVLRWDDPWWGTHYPPNGWNCRCSVIQLDDADLRERGLSPGVAPRGLVRRWVNPRTGRVREVPEGVDPAWAYHVGRAAERQPLEVLGDRVERLPEALARMAVEDILRSRIFEDFSAGRLAGWLPVAVLPQDLREALGVRTRTVRMSRETLQKQLVNHPEVTTDDYQGIALIIDAGRAWKQSITHQWVIGEYRDRLWRVIIKRTRDREETVLVSFHRVRRKDLRAADKRHRRVR